MKSNISQARINQQIRNMMKQPLPNLKATPLENDIYTWHFTIQGPQNSDFHQGLYHGQILLPFQYPFKPPDIVFMNKNARFQTNTKICLTITQYHPEEWNSAWTIRTMLEAVISLFSENIQGIGYQEGSPQYRKSLARKSHDYKCDKCGVLKDLLKPRQPRKQEEKKQQIKKQDTNDNIPSQKLEYASDLNIRKIKTQDHQTYAQRKISQKIKQKIQQQKDKKLLIKRQSKKEQALISKQRKDQEYTQHQTKSKFNIYPDNDSIQLDHQIQRNYASWARVLKSQKWTTIQ